MKTFLTAAALALLPLTAAGATFTGCAGFSLDPATGDGSVDILDIGAFECAFSLTGSNTLSGDGITTSFLATMPATSDWTVDFSWQYSTQDSDGSFFDHFSYAIDGLETQLSTDGLPSPSFHSGSESLFLAGGASFGWLIESFDDQRGRADVDVFANFSPAIVPVPAGLVLLVSGLAGLGMLRRRAAQR